MIGETVTILESRWKLLGSAISQLIFGTGLLSGAILLFPSRDPHWIVLSMIVLVPSGAVLIITGLWVFHGAIWARRIEISEMGLRLSRWSSPIPWSQFEPFKIVYEGTKYDWWAGRPITVYREAPPGKAFVRWAVKPGVPPPGFLSVAGDVSKACPVKPVDLAATLEEWRTKYADLP